MDFEGGIQKQFAAFKQELLNESAIMNVAISSQTPLSIGQDTIGIQWDGKADNDNTLYSMLSVGYDFIETMKIKLRDGRVFSPDFGTDSTNYIINEKAALSMGMDDPVGQPLTVWDEKGVIIGRVKDFHMQSLYSPIEPVIIRLAPASTGIVFIRIAVGQTEQGPSPRWKRSIRSSILSIHSPFASWTMSTSRPIAARR